MEDISNIVYKDKYQKKKRKGPAQTATYAKQLKEKVQRGYVAARAVHTTGSSGTLAGS